MSANEKKKELRHKGKSYAKPARPKIAPGNESFRDPNYICTQLIIMSFVWSPEMQRLFPKNRNSDTLFQKPQTSCSKKTPDTNYEVDAWHKVAEILSFQS